MKQATRARSRSYTCSPYADAWHGTYRLSIIQISGMLLHRSCRRTIGRRCPPGPPPGRPTPPRGRPPAPAGRSRRRPTGRTAPRPARSAPWRPRCRTRRPRSSRNRTTPSAAARPNALPPVRSTACTSSTSIPGRRRSVSRVPGAPPRTSPDPTVPGGHSTTVHPVSPSGSVAFPTRIAGDVGDGAALRSPGHAPLREPVAERPRRASGEGPLRGAPPPTWLNCSWRSSIERWPAPSRTTSWASGSASAMARAVIGGVRSGRRRPR